MMPPVVPRRAAKRLLRRPADLAFGPDGEP